MPLISVLMPAYNAEKYIAEAIDSVLRQTCGDWELVVIDDGSTDRTADIIRGYDDSRIRYYANEENLGIAKSYNHAIAKSSGEYLAVTEADDVNHPRRFEVQARYLDEHPQVGVVSSRILKFKKSPPKPQKVGDAVRVQKDTMQIKCESLFGKNGMRHPANMMRASLLAEHNIRYNAGYKICGDFDILMQCIPHTRVVELQPRLVFYRWHGANMSGDAEATNSEADDICRRFVQAHFALDLAAGLDAGERFFMPGDVTPDGFARLMHATELLLQTASAHPQYDARWLQQSAAAYAYEHFRRLYASGVDQREIFAIYRRTPLLHRINRKRKFRVYLKYLAHQLHLYGG